MLGRPVQVLLSSRRVDQALQRVLGSGRTRRALQEAVSRHSPGASSVLDLGGGAGRLREIWPPGVFYLCLDPDRRKLGWIPRGAGRTRAVEGDGTGLPLRSASLDAVVCRSVLHHLADGQLPFVIRECARVLMPDGCFYLMDPLWKPYRLPGRLLWWLDRGRYPRSLGEIRAAFESGFEILDEKKLAVVHEYVLLVGRPRRA